MARRSTSPFYHPMSVPAVKNMGGLNAMQLAIQKDFQSTSASWNEKINSLKKFSSAPSFNDNVKNFWNGQIDKYSDITTQVIKGEIGPSEAKKAQDAIKSMWDTWSKAAPYIAALSQTTQDLSMPGQLDKLNDPNIVALMKEMQTDGTGVQLQEVDGKLYLSGNGMMYKTDAAGESMGEELPWSYDMNLGNFLTSLGVGTYENSESDILENLNSVIRKRVTQDDMDISPIINAAIAGSTYTADWPQIEKGGKKSGEKTQGFLVKELFEYQLNHGGLNRGSASTVEEGPTMWLGTDKNPSLMDMTNFDSYYANVLYQDYQPYFKENGEVEWLIQYDDNGIETDRVKPWNVADQDIFTTTRDMLTELAYMDGERSGINRAFTVELKDGSEGGPNYKEILETEFNGNIADMYRSEDYDLAGDPFEYFTGINKGSKLNWQTAEDLYNKNNAPVVTPPETQKPTCDKDTQIYDPISNLCIPKSRYASNEIWRKEVEENSFNNNISKNRTTTEDIIKTLNNRPWDEFTSKEYWAAIKGPDGKPMGAVILDSNPDDEGGEIEIFIPNIKIKEGDIWSQRGWKPVDRGVWKGGKKVRERGVNTIVDINFSKHKKYEDLVDLILEELKLIGAQNL